MSSFSESFPCLDYMIKTVGIKGDQVVDNLYSLCKTYAVENTFPARLAMYQMSKVISDAKKKPKEIPSVCSTICEEYGCSDICETVCKYKNPSYINTFEHEKKLLSLLLNEWLPVDRFDMNYLKGNYQLISSGRVISLGTLIYEGYCKKDIEPMDFLIEYLEENKFTSDDVREISLIFKSLVESKKPEDVEGYFTNTLNAILNCEESHTKRVAPQRIEINVPESFLPTNTKQPDGKKQKPRKKQKEESNPKKVADKGTHDQVKGQVPESVQKKRSNTENTTDDKVVTTLTIEDCSPITFVTDSITDEETDRDNSTEVDKLKDDQYQEIDLDISFADSFEIDIVMQDSLPLIYDEKEGKFSLLANNKLYTFTSSNKEAVQAMNYVIREASLRILTLYALPLFKWLKSNNIVPKSIYSVDLGYLVINNYHIGYQDPLSVIDKYLQTKPQSMYDKLASLKKMETILVGRLKNMQLIDIYQQECEFALACSNDIKELRKGKIIEYNFNESIEDIGMSDSLLHISMVNHVPMENVEKSPLGYKGDLKANDIVREIYKILVIWLAPKSAVVVKKCDHFGITVKCTNKKMKNVIDYINIELDKLIGYHCPGIKPEIVIVKK